MKDRNLLKQKLALIASNAVLSDSVTCALDDAVALLGEDAEEIDKLRRHTSLSNDEIVINALKNARLKIENLLNESLYGRESIQYLYYCKGVRDACWAIDDMINDLRYE